MKRIIQNPDFPGRSTTAAALTALTLVLLSGCGGSGNSSTSTGTTTGTTGTPLTRAEFAYVANADDNTVSQFKIGTDGSLAPLSPATVPVTANAAQVLVTPNARFVYVIAQSPSTGAATASQFQISSSGALAPLAPATVSLGVLLVPTASLNGTNFPRPVQTALDPQGRFLYAAAASQILAVPISASGTLGTPRAAGALTTPLQAFALDPLGRFAFAGTQTSAGVASLAVFQIAADGTFTRRAGPDTTLAGATRVAGLAEDTKGRFLYAAVATPPDSDGNSGMALSQFQIGAGGALTLVKTTPVKIALTDTNSNFLFSAVLAFQPVFDTTGQFAYLPTATPRLLEESVGADGSLTPLGAGSVLAGAVTTSISIDPSGMFLYVANQDTSVAQYRRNADGTLTPLIAPIVQTGHRPISIATVFPGTSTTNVKEKQR